MAAEKIPPPAVGMRVRLRKPHACGSDAFAVTALGADIRLKCDGCGTKIFVDRARFANRVRVVLPGPSVQQPDSVQ